MRVLLFGGTGAVGIPTARALRAAGHNVILAARANTNVSYDYVRVDIFDPASVAEAVERVAPQAIVVHVTSLPQQINPRALARIYTHNDRARSSASIFAARAAHSCGAHLVVQSTAFNYAPAVGLAVEAEKLWTDGPGAIGASARRTARMEEQLEQYGATILRCGYFYGPKTYYAPDGDIGRRIRRGTYPIIGPGTGIASFVHVEGVASATVAALHLAPAIYNVVDDRPAEAKEWIPELARAYGGPRPKGSSPDFYPAEGPEIAAW